jgi:hypothetical protein
MFKSTRIIEIKYIFTFSYLLLQINADVQSPVSIIPVVQLNKVAQPLGLNENPKRMELINAFKLKLLELLDLKQIPNVNSIELNVPEPAMQEYARIVQEDKNKKTNEMSTQNDEDSTWYNKLAKTIITSDTSKNENIRFKSSFIQEINMFARKSNDDSWCTKNDKNLKALSCLQFELRQNEFFDYDLDEALLYFKLNRQQLLNLNYLFVSLNGRIVKKFELTKLSNNELYEHVDLKDIITENILDTYYKESKFANSDPSQVYPRIDIKILTTRNTPVQNGLYDELNRQSMLSIRFGDRSVKQLELQLQCHLSRFANTKYCTYFSPDSNSTTARTRRLSAWLPHIDQNKNSQTQAKQTQQSDTDPTKSSNILSFVECDQIDSTPIAVKRCCRETIRIKVEELGWQNWIAEPREFDFKYCRGTCSCKCCQ